MVRIRSRAKDDPLVLRLLAAAFDAMAKDIGNHAAEWMPAEVATDGSITKEGKLAHDVSVP